MDNYIVVVELPFGEKYVTNKTHTMDGVKHPLFTEKKIEAKFYTSEKLAQNRADKINNMNLYVECKVKKIVTSVACSTIISKELKPCLICKTPIDRVDLSHARLCCDKCEAEFIEMVNKQELKGLEE